MITPIRAPTIDAIMISICTMFAENSHPYEGED
jgi:hypothetical protein